MDEPDSVDLPGVDELTAFHTVFATARQHVAFTPALGTFLVMSELEHLPPVVYTPWPATISAQASLELGRHAAVWAAAHPQFGVVDAMTGRRLTTFDDAFEGFPRPETDTIALPPVSASALGAIGFEIVVQHRATDDLVVGALVEHVLATLGGEAPDAWGSTEPFTRLWNRTEVTQLAQQQMPTSSVIRGSSPDHSWFTLFYERSATGVVERLRGGVILGPYDEVADTATDAAERLLRSVYGSFRVTLASASLLDVDAEGAQTIRSRHTEVPLSLLLGPWAMARANIDVPMVERAFGAAVLGRAKVASLLFGFDGPHENPWQNYTELVAAVGLGNIAEALGVPMPAEFRQVHRGH